MKLNFLLFLIPLAFFTVLGILGSEYYVSIRAIDNGLQQCKVWNQDHTRYDILWQELCD